METLKPEIVALLQYLVPGFVAMIVYRALIASPQPEPFRATVEALVFTAIVQFFVAGEKWSALGIGHLHSFGAWTPEGQNTAAFLTAIVVGFVAVSITSFDSVLFKHLRRWHLTAQASYPNEWFGAFKREKEKWIVLHLTDGRRLFGWPTEWPSSPESGHVRMQRAIWLKSSADGKDVDLSAVSSILINVKDVRWVEFVDQKTGVQADGHETTDTATRALAQGSCESDQPVGADSPRSAAAAAATTAAAASPGEEVAAK